MLFATMKTSSKWLLGAALVVLMSCDLQKTVDQSTAKTVAVATLLSTPAVTVSASAVLGDAGASFDGGLDADAGITVPPQNAAFVFFGQRQGTSLDTAPTGVAGAKVTLRDNDGGVFTLTDTGSGNYTASSGFTYLDGATYQFIMESGGESYIAQVEKVPARETITQFHPSEGVVRLAANSTFTFTRPDPAAGTDRNLGFVTVVPLGGDGQQGTPTYTNVPTKPLEFLKLVVSPADWKTTTVTLPASAFPTADTKYIVLFQSAKLGGPSSSNLWIGSAILAGTAEVGVFITNK
jgi:hypothetical protein